MNEHRPGGEDVAEGFPFTREVRKTVTVLFCDLVDSTGMGSHVDAEVLRTAIQEYFDVASKAIAMHQGTAEKFIGDAVMAVFGHPRIREDDALRAVRAAIEVRERVEEYSRSVSARLGFSLVTRIGVNTGQVMAGDVSKGHGYVTGDAVNVAARLQGAAAPGEIVIGHATYVLTRDAVIAEATGPLALKGKGDTPGWRVVGLSHGPPSRDSPFVGRRQELALLEHAFERAARDWSCQLFTVLGSPGIGKSRLVAEFVSRLHGEVAVVGGGCPSYGTGITFRPIVEIITATAGIRGSVAGTEAVDKLASHLRDDPDAEAIVARLAPLLGASETAVAKEEVSWAFRRLLESVARRRPLVVLVDDVQWAAPMLLDLLEHVSEWSSDTRIVLVCLARDEFLELRPGWGGGKPNATSIELKPLSRRESEQFVDLLHPVDPELRAVVVDKAGGNPLFLEQMLAHALEHDPGDVSVPLTVQAIVDARLDQLTPDERAVVAGAAVIGRAFHPQRVADLASSQSEEDVRARLQTLVRKGVVRRRRPLDAESGEFRFDHSLIRDAAYESMPMQVRAELHERLAHSLDDAPAERPPDFPELSGYHLEAAYGYHQKLLHGGERERDLALAAADRLATAAERAFTRDDLRAAIALLERVAALSALEPGTHADHLHRLGAVLYDAGELARAEPILREAIEVAAAAGERTIEHRAQVEHEFVLLQGAGSAQARAVADEALEVFAAAGDDLGLCRAWMLHAWIDWTIGRVAAAEAAWRRAEACAGRAGAERRRFEVRSWLGSAAVWGSTPVAQAIEACSAIREQVRTNRVVEALTLWHLAGLRAMLGEFEAARAFLHQADEILAEVPLLDATVSHAEAMVETLQGDHAAAESRLRTGYLKLQALGERSLLSTTAAWLAQAVYEQGRWAEAEQLARESAELAPPDDVWTEVIWRGVSAKVLARRGAGDEGEAVAREALALIERTDLTNLHGDALMDLAETLRLAGREGEAAGAIRGAIALFDRKGNVVAAHRARASVQASA